MALVEQAKRRNFPPRPALLAPLVTAATFAAVGTVPASAASTTAEIPARGAFFAGAGFADRNGAAVEGFAIKFFNGALTFLGGAHGDKGKTARTLRGAIENEMGVRDRADSGKKFFQRSFRGLEGEVADIQFHIQWGVGGRQLRLSKTSANRSMKSTGESPRNFNNLCMND
jgi:hypothetical protein